MTRRGVASVGFEPTKAEPAVLLTAPFDHSGNLPGSDSSAKVHELLEALRRAGSVVGRTWERKAPR